jgi:hypothetical protein
MTSTNQVALLAERVRTGDYRAAALLSQQLQESLRQVVRRALDGTGQLSPLARRIRAHFTRLTGNAPPRDGVSDDTLDQVVQQLCVTVIHRLQAQPRQYQAQRDTIIN